MIPYGKQSIDETDIQAVVECLRSDFLTQGPKVAEFEQAFASKVGAKHAVAVNSGTAALHACMIALGIGPGDEVIVPPITFTASANCVLFVGGTPVFADVTPSGHIDPEQIEQKITKNTKAVIAVDYAGWPCNYGRILAICQAHGLKLICDACHALGATWNGKPVGSIGLLNNFSFHPVKHIATGEGGMVTTDDAALAERMREFRTHGITKDASRFKGLGERVEGGNGKADMEQSSAVTPHPLSLSERGPWHYEMHSLGFNYRMSDINCALGLSQLGKLDRFVARRRAIANMYYRGLDNIAHVQLPTSDLSAFEESGTTRKELVTHSFHLFPVLIDYVALGKTRTRVMAELKARGVGTQVHYIPVCLQPYYRERLGIRPGHYPAAEAFFARELSMPMYPAMSDENVQVVIRALREALNAA
jgi:perosamine synthetase